MIPLLNKYKVEINGLCKEHHVQSLYLFGSALNNNFNEQSDIDLVARFNDVPLLEYADNYFSFCHKLEEVLGRKVDVIDEKSIQNPFFKEEVDETKQLLFAA